MKQIIIFLLLVIILIIGYGQYSQYKRFNSEAIAYKTDKNLDIAYYKPEVVLEYNEAIEELNSYIMLQWTANDIDVRTPKDDDIETKIAVESYSKKLGKVHFYEALLTTSSLYKENGLTNQEIKFIVENGTDLDTYNRKLKYKKIKKLFNANVKLYNGSKNAIIYEVQKELNKKGHSVEIDGVYRIETLNAIKDFEAKNNLLADGFLDDLTIEMLFQ